MRWAIYIEDLDAVGSRMLLWKCHLSPSEVAEKLDDAMALTDRFEVVREDGDRTRVTNDPEPRF